MNLSHFRSGIKSFCDCQIIIGLIVLSHVTLKYEGLVFIQLYHSHTSSSYNNASSTFIYGAQLFTQIF